MYVCDVREMYELWQLQCSWCVYFTTIALRMLLSSPVTAAFIAARAVQRRLRRLRLVLSARTTRERECARRESASTSTRTSSNNNNTTCRANASCSCALSLARELSLSRCAFATRRDVTIFLCWWWVFLSARQTSYALCRG